MTTPSQLIQQALAASVLFIMLCLTGCCDEDATTPTPTPQIESYNDKEERLLIKSKQILPRENYTYNSVVYVLEDKETEKEFIVIMCNDNCTIQQIR